jgi:hypothetical protein
MYHTLLTAFALLCCAVLCCAVLACRNALAYILFAEGIPYIYYGTEQGYTTDREPLWHSGYSKEHPLWLFLRISVAYRKEAKVRTHTHTCKWPFCVTKCDCASHVA